MRSGGGLFYTRRCLRGTTFPERELCPHPGVELIEMSPEGDAELMRRVQGGDREAFAALVERHKGPLVRFLGALSRDRDRAEEIAQDAFVRLFEQSDRYQERGQFAPYLYRIASNLLRTEDRKRRRRALLLKVFSSNGHHDPAPSPQTVCLREELSYRLSQAIATIPLRYRSPLVLRDVEGWSYTDIARAMSCGEGTVKSRIHRGRERLRRALEPYWNGGR
jgi:RNA polymerase sigma-70 factor (ECF subfamily)